MSDDDCQHQCYDGKCIVDEYLGVYQHTHRHEEDGAEEVLDGFHQLLNMLGLDRLCQDASHDESSESRRETNLRREDSHRTAQSQRHDEQHFVVHQSANLTQEGRNGKDSYHQPQHQEEAYLDDGPQHLSSVGVVAGGNGTQHHHHDDGQNIFQNEHRHHQSGKLLLAQAKVVEGFIDNRCRTHGEHSSEEDAVHS